MTRRAPVRSYKSVQARSYKSAPVRSYSRRAFGRERRYPITNRYRA